jgi:hypothetical protein
VKARKRLFGSGAAPGRYRIQFDGFRKFRSKREIEYDDLVVTISS